MSKQFDFTTMDALLEKIKNSDPDGQLALIVNDLIFNSKKAADIGITMDEIAALSTLGYFISQEPEIQQMVEFLLSSTKPNEFIN
jgi:hypothetical protein|tara:strand:+ start:442 stop:696 length:255 start_codon:yes stop_codon:yes gene_type:complete